MLSVQHQVLQSQLRNQHQPFRSLKFSHAAAAQMRCSSPRSNEIHQSAPWNVEPRVINSNGSIRGCIPGPAASRRAQRLGRKASASGLGCHHLGVCLHWNNCSPTYQEAGPSLPTKGEGAQHPLQLIFLQGVHRMKNKLHDGFLQTLLNTTPPLFLFFPLA